MKLNSLQLNDMRTPYFIDPDRAADEDDMPEVQEAEPRDYVPEDIGSTGKEMDRWGSYCHAMNRRNHD